MLAVIFFIRSLSLSDKKDMESTNEYTFLSGNATEFLTVSSW